MFKSNVSVTYFSILVQEAQTHLKVGQQKEHLDGGTRSSYTLLDPSSWYAVNVNVFYEAVKYLLFQMKHDLAFKYAKQQKEHLSTLNLFCNLQIYATVIFKPCLF